MQKTTAEKLTDIFSPMLDENNCITLPEAERLINEAEFNISEIGFDNLIELLDELKAQFNMDIAAETPTIKCLLVQKEEPAPAKPQTLSCKQKNLIKYKIVKSIEFLSTRNAQWKGLIPLTKLEKQLKYVGVDDYGGMSLYDFIKQYPNRFELSTVKDTTCVKMVSNFKSTSTDMPDSTIPTMQQTPATEAIQIIPAAKPDMTTEQEKTLSIYELLDFASFRYYKKALENLAEISEPDGWFILDEFNEPDPYFLVDLKLRYNFALAVQRQVCGIGDDIRLSLTSAEVDTGFHTKDGQAVIAHFSVNRKRNTKNFQSWSFQYFSAENLKDEQDEQ